MFPTSVNYATQWLAFDFSRCHQHLVKPGALGVLASCMHLQHRIDGPNTQKRHSSFAQVFWAMTML
jgi:hypothetical protein